MTITTQTPLHDPPPPPPPPPVEPGTHHRGGRFLRGRPGDPVWVRPSLFGLLAVTAALYLWDLSSSGWANSFYAAAVQAGTQSWKAFFFGSSDAANFITVDKPPASLWVMEISARIFGLNSWSLLVPQVLEGVASVGVLYLTVRRAASAGAGLVAGAILALTPVAALMFRYDNPDALLVLLLVGAAYATTRYLDRGRTAWLVGAGSLVGVAFLTKSLQAFVVVPVLAAVVLGVSPLPLRRRLRDLVIGGVAMLAAGGWWVAAVELTPAADRPYIGGSQDNSLFNVIFGYNGFGRLTGNETGSVGGGRSAAGTGMWGPTGLTRLFNASFGGQISWLLPAALILLAVGLVLTGRAARTDRARTGLLIWGGWLVVTGLLFSLSKGIIHPYYTVALAPAIAAVVGIAASLAWVRRGELGVRLAAAIALGVSAVWGFILLDRSPDWHPWLRYVVVIAGLAAAVGWVVLGNGARWLRTAVAASAVAACLAAPLASTLATVTTPHSGAIPSAGPTVAASFGGFGFGGHSFRAGRTGGGGFFGGGVLGGRAVGGAPGRRGGVGGVPVRGPAGGGRATGGTFRSVGGGRGVGASRPSAGHVAFGGGSARGGAMGGLLGSSTPSTALVDLLEQDRSSYTWVAAVTDSEAASGYQLATDDPVMAIGGFNGTDPAPSLAAFERDVADGRIHWYIASSTGGFGASTSSTDDASRIATWVEAHYRARTVGGVTLYDLGAAATK